MTILTAAAAGAGIRVAVSDAVGLTAILRSDANGIAPVRTLPNTWPLTGYMAVMDWEAATTGTVTYTAAEASARAFPDVSSPWLIFPLRPGLGLELLQVNDYAAGRASMTISHHVPGRPDPLLALGALAYRTGTLDILCRDLMDARRVEAELNRSAVAMLKSPDVPGLDMYFVASATGAKPADNGHWMVTAEYTETARPTANLRTWTMNALRTAFPNFATAAATFANMDALTRNDRAA